MKLKIRFIINPISGVAQKKIIPSLIKIHLDQTKFSYDFAHTEFRSHARELAYQAVLDGVDIVCAVGGDGSVHEVGTALIGTKAILAIIPAGSGNGLARHLKIPCKFKAAILCINKLNIQKIDTVFVNDKSFLGIAGYGFDAFIAEKFDSHHRRGFWGYASIIFREYKKYQARKFLIKTESETINERYVLCTISNSSEFGNGFVVSPESSMADGKLELCLMKPLKFHQNPVIVYKFFRKVIHKCKYMRIVTFKKARIILDQKIAHYDGEPFEVRKELNIEVIEKSLLIISGKNKI